MRNTKPVSEASIQIVNPQHETADDGIDGLRRKESEIHGHQVSTGSKTGMATRLKTAEYEAQAVIDLEHGRLGIAPAPPWQLPIASRQPAVTTTTNQHTDAGDIDE